MAKGINLNNVELVVNADLPVDIISNLDKSAYL